MPQTSPRYRRYTSEVRAAMLIEAGLACLAEGGIAAFTIDNICAKAGASRGLVTHHFGSKEGLLAAVYAAAYQPMLASLAPEAASDLASLIDHLFAPANVNPGSLKIWLALWAEIATSPALQAEHRKHYAVYRQTVAQSLQNLALSRNLDIDAAGLAVSVIALIDGLWLEHCIDPELLSPDRAKTACLRLLTPIFGHFD
jgi:TetR/AcrR family transcriptional regulator, transcriptional repressor of bet genes